MTVTEKAAYLKGLYAGLNISEEKNEGKMFSAIVDLLEDLALSVQDLEGITGDMEEELDDLSSDLTDLEDEVYGVDEECDCGDDATYEVACPSCGEVLYIDDGVLDEGSINCPSCGEELEFDVSGLDDEEDDEADDEEDEEDRK